MILPASQSILPAADGLFNHQFQVQPRLTVLPVLHLLRLPLPTQLHLALLHLDGHLALPLPLLLHRLPLPVELDRLQSPSPTAAAASTGTKQRDASHAQWKEGAQRPYNLLSHTEPAIGGQVPTNPILGSAR